MTLEDKAFGTSSRVTRLSRMSTFLLSQSRHGVRNAHGCHFAHNENNHEVSLPAMYHTIKAVAHYVLSQLTSQTMTPIRTAMMACYALYMRTCIYI